jgi:hypothetical protein
MRTDKDVEAYLLRLNRRYCALGEPAGTFLVEMGPGLPPVALRVDSPLVVLRVQVGSLPSGAGSTPAPLLRKLLELNARQLVHTSFGLDEDRVLLSSALELENLDFNELQTALDETEIVLAQQLPELARMAPDAFKTKAG